MNGENLVSSAQSAKWAAIIEQQPHDFYHTLSYCLCAAEIEGGTPIAFSHKSASGSIFLPLILRDIAIDGRNCGRDAITPYGYPGPLVVAANTDVTIADVFPAFLRFCRELGLVSVFTRFHPLLTPETPAWEQWGRIVRHGDTVSINLTLGQEQLWRQIRNNHKRDIKSLKADGFEAVDDANWDLLDEFIIAYTETMRRVNASNFYFFPPSYYRKLRDLFRGNAHLIMIRKEQEIAAGGIFVRTGPLVQYHLGGTKLTFLNQAPSKLMFHHAMAYFANSGASVLHLGGGLGGQTDALFNFKLGFGTHTHPYYSLRTIVDQNSYDKLCTQTGLIAQSDGFFPTYRAPH